MRLERSALIQLAIIALALASGLLLVLTREKPTTSERNERANNLFTVFRRDELAAIDVRNGNEIFQLGLALSGDAGAPSYTLKEQGAADPEAAKSFVRALELAAFLKRFQGETVDRQAFGLTAPRGELRLHFAKRLAILRVGKAALSPKQSSYVEVEADGARAVGLIRDAVLSEILPRGDELRPRALLGLGLGELARIEARDGERAFDVRRGPGAAWLDASGQRVRRDAVEHLVFELATVKANPFVDAASARAALERDGALSVTFTPKSGPAQRIRIGSTCPHNPELLLAERAAPSTWSACIPGGVRQLFTNTSENLVDSAAFALHMDEVEALVILREGKKLELLRNERGFELRMPAQADVALDAGNQRLGALLAAKGELLEKPELAAQGLALPLGSVALRSSAVEGNERFEEVLDLGRLDARGRLFVRRRDDGRVLLIERDDARAFNVDTTLLRSTKVFDFGPSELLTLSVIWGNERQTLRATQGGSFELAEPAGAPVEGALTLELAQALGTLTALYWLADEDDGSFGLQRPAAEARLTLEPKQGRASSVTLRLGKSLPGGVSASVDTLPGVFVAPRSLLTTLTTLVLSRAAFSQDSTRLDAIELGHGEKRLRLARHGNQFRATPELPETTLGSLLEHLANLRAEAAVHTGPALASEGLERPTLTVHTIPKAGQGKPTTFRVGALGTFHNGRVFYARAEGIDATFALPEYAVRGLLEAF